VNSHSDYRVSLAVVPEFDPSRPMSAELAVLEVFIPELMTALLDAVPGNED
jgi:hypothetical protein